MSSANIPDTSGLQKLMQQDKAVDDQTDAMAEELSLVDKRVDALAKSVLDSAKNQDATKFGQVTKELSKKLDEEAAKIKKLMEVLKKKLDLNTKQQQAVDEFE